MNTVFKRTVAVALMTDALNGDSYSHIAREYRIPRTTVRRWAKKAYSGATGRKTFDVSVARVEHKLDTYVLFCAERWVLSGETPLYQPVISAMSRAGNSAGLAMKEFATSVARAFSQSVN